MKPTEHDIRDTGQLPRCTGCGAPHGILDRSVMQASVTRGPGHRELWTAMLCERCAVKLVERASALDAASSKPVPAAQGKPAAYYGGVPIYETKDPFFAGKGLVAVQQALSSPAAERADEGLEEEARVLRKAWLDTPERPQNEGIGNWPDWLRVARVARALRRGGVTADLLREANDLYGKFDLASEHGSKLRLDLSERIEAHLAALDSGASVVVDREEWERTKADLERLRAFYRSVNDEIPEGLWPAATTLDAFRKLVDGYANVCADAKALHEREEERDRALADTEHRHALAERERDQLAAKLAEAERSRDDAKTLLEGAMHGQAMAEEDVRNARAEAERLREANTKLLMGTAPPTVAVTNHALAASKIVAALLPRAGDLDAAMARGQTEAILRDCARAADVDALRSAMEDERRKVGSEPGEAWKQEDVRVAKRALAHLGLALAQEPPCEHKRGNGWANTDGSGGFKCSDCPHEVKYPPTPKGPEPVATNAAQEPRDVVLEMPSVDAGPLARAQQEELHRLLAPVLDAAGFAPGQETARAAINRILMQWRSGLEPRIPGTWGDIARPDWIDEPFTQPFATPVLMVEGAEHLRSYAVSMERCAHEWRERFKQEASDHASTRGALADIRSALASIRSQLEAREKRKEGTREG